MLSEDAEWWGTFNRRTTTPHRMDDVKPKAIAEVSAKAVPEEEPGPAEMSGTAHSAAVGGGAAEAGPRLTILYAVRPTCA